MTTKQRSAMYAAIEKHGRDLLALFPNAKIQEPVKLCKALRRLELKAHKAAENYCNGCVPMTGDCANDDNYWHNIGEGCAVSAQALLGFPVIGYPVVLFFNGDARGYALKLKPDTDICGINDVIRDAKTQLCRDMGGYGIIAPDFTPDQD